jgi:hypothetical protein
MKIDIFLIILILFLLVCVGPKEVIKQDIENIDSYEQWVDTNKIIDSSLYQDNPWGF